MRFRVRFGYGLETGVGLLGALQFKAVGAATETGTANCNSLIASRKT